MLRTRVIPALLVRDQSLVKTVRFGKFTYVGDPCNTVRIFNELEVDELMVLDILASRHGQPPDFALLADLANECFMPVSYGGGIRTVRDGERILKIGLEKLVVNSAAVANPGLVHELAREFGSQAVVASIDFRRNLLGNPKVYLHAAQQLSARDPLDWALELEQQGAGELLLTSVDREGTWSGFDWEEVRRIADRVRIPVIAHGGGRDLASVGQVVREGHASAVALGSMVVFQKQGMGVLVNFPGQQELARALEANA